MADASREEHAPVDTRPYLPEGWTKDRGRCEAVGVLREVGLRTRHEPSSEMLEG